MNAMIETPDLPNTLTERKPVASLLLAVENLTVSYNGEPALAHVSFAVYSGERVAVIGPNGAGKSTLFQSILGLLQPRSGSVTLHGIDREQIGYVPQSEGIQWDFPVTVRDVVMMGRTRRIGWLRFPGKGDTQAVSAALDRVGMSAFSHRQVGELSGGQRRRVFIARALAQEAQMLVLDEPFSGVDVQAQRELIDVLERLNREGLTILLSTHDLDLAYHRFDKVLALRRSVIGFGPPSEVYTPDRLAQMYGGRLAVWDKGERVSVFVDDHGCHDC